MTTTILTVLTAVGAATFGGAMFAFSGFVMLALDRTPTRAAVLAMQEINLAAPRPPLVTVMVGTTLTSLALVVLAVLDVVRGDATSATWLTLAGCAGILAGIVITGRFHIPRNDALASVDPDGPDAAAAWTAYSGPWQRGNHLRTACTLAGAALLVVSLTV
jgi:uncharacterized membrane protein